MPAILVLNVSLQFLTEGALELQLVEVVFLVVLQSMADDLAVTAANNLGRKQVELLIMIHKRGHCANFFIILILTNIF